MSLYDPYRDCVANDRWCGTCAVCGEEFLKKEMTAVSIKRQYTNPRVVCHICDKCMLYLVDKYELDLNVSL